jgi:hypothetical protein
MIFFLSMKNTIPMGTNNIIRSDASGNEPTTGHEYSHQNVVCTVCNYEAHYLIHHKVAHTKVCHIVYVSCYWH